MAFSGNEEILFYIDETTNQVSSEFQQSGYHAEKMIYLILAIRTDLTLDQSVNIDSLSEGRGLRFECHSCDPPVF